ncbi:MAG: GNAT family N-acetyltransferase [Bacteroidia bacterium]
MMTEVQTQSRIKTASEKEILMHLTACDNNFIPHLSKKVNLVEYSKKIADNAITFEAWSGPELVGLIAAYFNDPQNNKGYITSVSVLPRFENKGIASSLMRNCIFYATQKNFKEINLEVARDNASAIALYKKFNFAEEGARSETLAMKLNLLK